MTATLTRPYAGAAPAQDRPASSVAKRWGRAVLVGGAIALLVVEVDAVWASLSSTFAAVLHAQPGWLLVAVLAAGLSMGMFARGRRRLLRAAGVPVTVRRSLAAAYVANAVHVTMPGGAAFSTAYTYRWMRGWGASRAAAAWSLAAGGIVSSGPLAGRPC